MGPSGETFGQEAQPLADETHALPGPPSAHGARPRRRCIREPSQESRPHRHGWRQGPAARLFSDALIVGPPGLDPFLDRLAVGDVLCQHLTREVGQLGVAGETQRDQLTRCEVVDVRLQILGQ